MNETEVLPSSNNISHLYKSEGGCGEASLSCMAFGYKSSIPIRCGILKNAPLCERLDPISKRMKCDVFCDTDGGGRLCKEAFPSCCLGSVNGCTSSRPRNIKLYKTQ
ncbi:hypothetical protein HMPREF1544_03482 [Mucor circinelloides 1006PhL]|uniref:Uncharacterized protein n=1 Tax=Mucor circinelloides f. circinelloides (strain 1006PhL) TaxID=1220926 RepID=S2K328_MUCC1|nr:hypothetical protein HMPREF1544_03482 [Mucor circinelloides 1006PhL]